MQNVSEGERLTRTLQRCGLLAGPLFMTVLVLQAATRPGFRFVDQPASLLSLGPGGAIQIANFLVAGLLMIGFAVGVFRRLHPGRAGSWGPWLLGGFGAGLLIAGLFPPDPALGFPPGTPEGLPAVTGYRSMLHGLGFNLSFLSLAAACLVFARRELTLGRRGAAVYALATAVVALGLGMWPGVAAIGLRVFLAALVAWTWTTILALRLGPTERYSPGSALSILGGGSHG